MTRDGTVRARPQLGLRATTALVVGNMIGSGLFLLPAALAPYGGAAILGFAASAAGALLLASVFARLGLRHPRSGGPVAFARLAFGDGVGYAVAWSYWVSICCGNAAIAVAFAGYFGALVPAALATPARAALTAVGALWLCVGANLFGIRAAGRVQLVTTLLKFVPLIAVAIAGVVWFEPSAWQPFNRSSESMWSVATTTAALTLWAFLGLECATVPADDVRDAARIVPLATLFGTALACVGTVLACMAVVGALPAATLATSSAPFADAATHWWGSGAGHMVAAVATISCFGALNGWVLMQGQIPLAAARNGLFPALFARCDANGTPVSALLVGGVLSSVLVLANFQQGLAHLFTFAILLSTAVTLLPYLVCSAAELRLARLAPLRRHPALATTATLLALAFSVWALIGVGREALAWGAVLILAGWPIFLWQRRRGGGRVERPPESAAH